MKIAPRRPKNAKPLKKQRKIKLFGVPRERLGGILAALGGILEDLGGVLGGLGGVLVGLGRVLKASWRPC